MRRILLEPQGELKRWASKKSRRPLILRGARQVGKSYCARQLGQTFEHFVEINFESQPQFESIFQKHFGDPKKILLETAALLGKPIVPGKTLLFLDEIQASKEAMLSLRYFYEKLPELHVLSAGSLLEFLLKEISFPVGRVEFMHVFPMNFTEFLWAHQQNHLLESILNVHENGPLSQSVHTLALEWFQRHLFVGGLPQAVQTSSQDALDTEISEIHHLMIGSYRQDFSKYASKIQIPRLRLLYDSVPRQLGQKWKYSEASTDIRPRELAPALDLLIDAGLAYKAFHSHGDGAPLSAQIKLDSFKLFSLDSGLCLTALGNQKISFHGTKGAVSEQWAAQEIIASTPPNQAPGIYHWHRESPGSTAEIDFLIEGRSQHSGQVIPIEIKSGGQTRARSLSLFLEDPHRSKKVPWGIVYSEKPDVVWKSARLRRLPIYALPALFHAI